MHRLAPQQLHRLAPQQLHRVGLPAHGLRRLASSVNLIDDAIPMSISDRLEAEALKKGTFDQLSGRGKPLSQEGPSQTYIASLPKNMEARAEAEMRRAERSGLLSNLGFQNEALPEKHVTASGRSQAAIQSHVQQTTLKK